MEGFPKLGVPFGGPHHKDYNLLGYILGSLFREPIISMAFQAQTLDPNTNLGVSDTKGALSLYTRWIFRDRDCIGAGCGLRG